jgi:hypothetical protein
MSKSSSDRLAWPEWFVVRSLGEELLVYDLRNQHLTSLNPFAAKVWRASDGKADAMAVAGKLSAEGVEVFDDRAIDLALDMLNKADLLESPVSVASKNSASSRRHFMRRVLASGTAAAVAIPAVVTIVVPTPAQADSIVPGTVGLGGICFQTSDCVTGLQCSMGQCEP